MIELSEIREVLQLLRQDEDVNQLETVLAFFPTFILESALIQEIMRWNMGVLRESPTLVPRNFKRRGSTGRMQQILSSIEIVWKLPLGSEELE